MLSIARRGLLVALACSFLLWGLTVPAAADPECAVFGDTDPSTDQIEYGCTEYVDGGGSGSGGDEDGGDTGGGDPVANQCTFFDIYSEFCRGDLACYVNDPAAIQDIDRAREDDPALSDKPDGAERLIFTACQRDPGSPETRDYYWDTEAPEEGPTLEDRIRSAAGQLVLPTITPVFNPPGRTLVNLDTWWWAEGASADEVVGTEALGVRAVATPRGMTVKATASRGSVSVACPVVTERSDRCSLRFTGAGQYEATLTVVYDVRFELNGEPIDLPGGLADLATLTATGQTTVPVLEVQSRVTDLG